MPPEIGFRPLSASDLPMVADWLSQPHWQEWWGDPGEELDHIRDMIEGRDSTRPFAILLDGVPAGYIQLWFIADQRVEPWLTEAPWLLLLPDDAVGVDLSLADPARLGQGIGARVLAAFVAKLRAEGFHEIWIDPDPENLRAVRAYEKAGFRVVEPLRPHGNGSLLMRYGGGTWRAD